MRKRERTEVYYNFNTKHPAQKERETSLIIIMASPLRLQVVQKEITHI